MALQQAGRSFTSGPRTARTATAAEQMAIDTHFLSRAVDREDVFVRTYRMVPPAVTIGRHQRWQRVIDREACDRAGWQWVRRPTGGGALLHRDEINYMVVAPRGRLAPTGVGEFRAVFDRIAHVLVAVLETLGAGTMIYDAGRPTRAEQHGLCGRSVTGHEIASREGKLVAAAQTITPHGILQHGTLYIHAPCSADRFWPVSSRGASEGELIQSWADISSLCVDLPWPEMTSRFEELLRKTLGVPCAPCDLAPEEWTNIGRQVMEWEISGWNSSR